MNNIQFSLFFFSVQFQAPTTVLPPLCFSAGMAPRLDDVMCLCSEIASHDQIKVAVKSSAKGAAVAGGTAFVGGLLGGPAGICVGKEETKQESSFFYYYY